MMKWWWTRVVLTWHGDFTRLASSALLCWHGLMMRHCTDFGLLVRAATLLSFSLLLALSFLIPPCLSFPRQPPSLSKPELDPPPPTRSKLLAQRKTWSPLLPSRPSSSNPIIFLPFSLPPIPRMRASIHQTDQPEPNAELVHPSISSGPVPLFTVPCSSDPIQQLKPSGSCLSSNQTSS